MTGFSFQSSQFVFFNVLEQEQPDQNKYVLYSDPELRNPHLFIHDESVIAGGGVRVVKKDERFYTVNQGSDLVRFLKEGLANKRDKFEALEIICRHV
ncbi:hypothetical protein HYY69_02675 [Candidatus Woesearchaeota archaeon]|nr:hypothetical protein [Candidatus Woesearchaeota archaeon]